MNVLETKEVNDSFSFDYFDVQNLVIDHSFSSEELESYKDLIFSPNSLQQIYFKGSCGLDTIELVKNLLTISEYIDDRKVEKYLLVDLSPQDVKTFLTFSFENPSTWKVPYQKVDDTYKLTDIPRFRTLQSYIRKLDDRNLSAVEQIMKIYDEVKLMEYVDTKDIDQLPEIVSKRQTNSYGFNALFTHILRTLGYNAFVGKTESDDGISYISVVEVVDPIYHLDGIYFFDPSMDSLSKEKYEDNTVRRMNYNFFMCPLSLIKRNKFNERFVGALSLLEISDLKYSEEKRDVCKDKKSLKELSLILKAFNRTYENLHNRLKRSKPISIDMIIKIAEKLYGDKHSGVVRDNYILRKEELFDKDTEEELNEFLEDENFQKN
ncbi:MAG: hypothetical protein IKO78_05875 [Bacilli bacterium]|nr:hypothetical protein [Bacilli bacterium]